MRLVVGLGNPGRRYRGTRHNVGFRVVDLLARRWGVSLRPEGAAEVAEARFAGQPVLLAKPLTYMNLSGQAVGELVRRWRIPPSSVLVVYDDMDLPTGALRVRARGSAGGHRGVASVLEALGTSEVPRVRVGIGRPGTDAVDHVLSRFTEAEEPLVAEAVERAAEAVETVLREGIQRAMDRFNRRTAPASAG
jgi:PTH1 family peptidyl-tRNA hydrolase